MRVLPLVLAASTLGCTVDVYDRHDVVYGSATIGWTIGGSPEPAACTAKGVSTVRVVVEHDDGTLVSDDRMSCRATSARYVLRRGYYAATLTVLDAAGAPLADPRRTGTFHVSAGDDTFLTIDLVVPGHSASASTAGAER